MPACRLVGIPALLAMAVLPIQMDVDAATRTVTVAPTTVTVRADGAELAAHVARTLVDRERACAERADARPRPGTCVFQCGEPDEALWRALDAPADAAAAAAIMSRARDRYLE